MEYSKVPPLRIARRFKSCESSHYFYSLRIGATKIFSIRRNFAVIIITINYVVISLLLDLVTFERLHTGKWGTFAVTRWNNTGLSFGEVFVFSIPHSTVCLYVSALLLFALYWFFTFFLLLWFFIKFFFCLVQIFLRK